jgi:hypothetical protein
MGWKASFIIINKPSTFDKEKLIKEFGYQNLTKIKDEPFNAVINPDDNVVYIGTYNNNFLICAYDIPMDFFEDNLSPTEEILIRNFPTSEICSIILHSVVNLWGFAVIQNGKKVRAIAGSESDGTFIEMGEPLEEEKELLSKSTIDENGIRTYLLESIDDEPDEPYPEDTVGEEFVFSICERYFGTRLDFIDDELFEMPLSGYSFTSKSNKQSVSKEPIKENKPWWKVW